MRSVSPGVAARTSADTEPVLTSVDRDKRVLRILRELVDHASSAWLVLGASLLAALGAVAVSPDRRRTTVHLGAGMVGAGLLVAGAVWLGGRVTAGYAARATGLAADRDRQAIDAVWAALFADARNAALVVALGGLLIAACAAGAGAPRGAAAHLRARLRAISGPVWLRDAALVGAGVLCLLEPDVVGRTLIVAAGAGLVAWVPARRRPRCATASAPAVSPRRAARTGPGRPAP